MFRMNVRGDGWAVGRFLQVDPPRRIVFTWGWDIERSPLPPGASVVEVELIPQGDGTLLRLTHRDLPPGSPRPPGRLVPLPGPAGRPRRWRRPRPRPLAARPLEPILTRVDVTGAGCWASAVGGSAGQPLDPGNGGGVQAEARRRTTSDTASASGANMSTA